MPPISKKSMIVPIQIVAIGYTAFEAAVSCCETVRDPSRTSYLLKPPHVAGYCGTVCPVVGWLLQTL